VSELRQRSARTTVRDGVVRHGKLKRGTAWKTLLAIVASTLAVVMVSGVSVAAIAVWQLQSSIETVTIEADEASGPPPSIGAYQGGFNILIVGSDTREGQGDAFGQDPGSVLNDVNMLLHVSEDQKSAVLVSIPRDMVVPLPACENGGPATGLPINETLYYGGLSCTVDTVQSLTGLKIHFAGMITFNGVISMSNAVGGVDVCIAAPIHDPYVGLHLDTAGTHTLKGSTALKFLRSRHGVGDGSDLGRISSQQVFLSSLVRKIKSDDTLTDFGKLYGIAQAATQNMTLSENFARPDTLVSIALALKNIPLENIAMVQYPSRTGGTGIYLGKVQPIPAVADALFAAIKADKPIALDANAVGANGGSQLDPNAPKPTEPAEPDPSASPDPSATPEDPGPKPQLIPGLKGQTAAQHTCSVAN
jgi:LCP family protein required for cell wall assembly